MNNFDAKDLGMWLKKICERLLNYDPDIVEIIQFGLLFMLQSMLEMWIYL